MKSAMENIHTDFRVLRVKQWLARDTVSMEFW